MTPKVLAQKRVRYPLFRYYGNVNQHIVDLLVNKFSGAEPTLSNAVKLRASALPRQFADIDAYVQNYNQYDIQTRGSDTPDVEDSYVNLHEDYHIARDEISYMLQSPVCRMRYATIQKNDELVYHIDQPGKDRFIIVLEGEQVVYIKKHKETFQQLMKPGELWYLNSNWEHKVENIGKQQRLALLGCFEYNN